MANLICLHADVSTIAGEEHESICVESAAVRAIPSVPRKLLHVVHDHHLHGCLPRFELESETLHGRKERRCARSIAVRRHNRGKTTDRGEVDVEIVEAGQAGFVEDIGLGSAPADRRTMASRRRWKRCFRRFSAYLPRNASRDRPTSSWVRPSRPLDRRRGGLWFRNVFSGGTAQ